MHRALGYRSRLFPKKNQILAGVQKGWGSHQFAFLVARKTLVVLFIVIFVCFFWIVTTRSGETIFDNVFIWVWMILLILLVASEFNDTF